MAFAKRKNRGNFRKRAAEEEEAAGDDGGGVVRKAQRTRDAPLAFSTKREDRQELFMFESSNTVQQQGDGGATRGNEQETEHDRDARALREQVLRQAAEGGAPTSGADGIYRGLNAYKDYRAGFRRENTIGAEKGGGAHGPLRASTNVRMSVLIDYKPDLCKDYKETGYCGYGDACKFMHDRGDYKAGWELDRDWEEQQKAKREAMLAGWRPDGEGDEGGGEGEEEEEEEDDLPFACLICRRPWAEAADPVVTKCRHHFCEQCALQHNAKSAKCFVCEQPTGGIFNVAHDVLKKEKARKRREAGG